MLIGQDRAGKTSLKKALFSLPFDPMEASTDGVEVDPSIFEVDVDRVKNWQRVNQKEFASEFAEEIARLVVGEMSQATTEEAPEEVDHGPVTTENVQLEREPVRKC